MTATIDCAHGLRPSPDRRAPAPRSRARACSTTKVTPAALIACRSQGASSHGVGGSRVALGGVREHVGERRDARQSPARADRGQPDRRARRARSTSARRARGRPRRRRGRRPARVRPPAPTRRGRRGSQGRGRRAGRRRERGGSSWQWDRWRGGPCRARRAESALIDPPCTRPGGVAHPCQRRCVHGAVGTADHGAALSADVGRNAGLHMTAICGPSTGQFSLGRNRRWRVPGGIGAGSSRRSGRLRACGTLEDMRR